MARLRLSAVLLDAGSNDEALSQLASPFTAAMQGLAADLRGDVLKVQGKNSEAAAAYQLAWQQLADSTDYRRLVEAKLNALGIDPQAGSSTSATGASK
jgi:predicted negative regulator of RcsB-dependent stress response